MQAIADKSAFKAFFCQVFDAELKAISCGPVEYRTGAISSLIVKALGWRKELHPRDKAGKFISIGKIEAASIDPKAAAELRKEVKPEDKQKLEDALGGVHADMPVTKRGQAKIKAHVKRLGKAESLSRLEAIKASFKDGTVTHEHLHKLVELLPGMRVQDLRDLRKNYLSTLAGKVGWDNARTKEQMWHRLEGWILHDYMKAHNKDAPKVEKPPVVPDEPAPAKADEARTPSRLDDPEVKNAELDAKPADVVDPKDNKEEAYLPKVADSTNKDDEPAPEEEAEAPPIVPEEEEKKPSELKKKLHEAIAHLDPEDVKLTWKDRQDTAGTLGEKVNKARIHLDELKEKARKLGTKQPERRNLNKEITKVSNEMDSLAKKRDEYMDSDSHGHAQLEHLAVNEDQPDFVRHAAINLRKKKNPDDTFEDIRGDVKEHLAKHGHDPELADAVAAEVSQSPRRAEGNLEGIIAGEKTRKGHTNARVEAKEFLKTLDLPPELVKQAEADITRLYSDGLEKFKTEWTASAKARKENEAHRTAVEKNAKDRHEKDNASTKKATDYIEAQKSGHALPETDPETLRKVARHALNAPAKWHSKVELPSGGSAKQQIDKVAGSPMYGRVLNGYARTLIDKGWLTDSKYMVKATTDMVTHAKTKGWDKEEGRPLPTEDIIKQSSKNTVPAKLVATRVGGDASEPRVLAQSEDGKQAEMDAKYVANIKKMYPDAEPFMVDGARPVLFKSKGEIVGLVMPLTSGGKEDSIAREINEGEPLQLSHVLERGPYDPEDMEDTGGMVHAGKGDKAMSVKIGGKTGAYTIGDHTDRTYGTYGQAVSAAKDILSHAHGTDENGLVFKPKGEKTELEGDEKSRVEFYKKLREHAKKSKGKAKKMKFGEGDKATERDVTPVTEHFGISKPLPDDKGKVDSGYEVLHLPTGMKASSWRKKDDATAHAIITQNLPDADWGSVTTQNKEENPEQHERLKGIGERMKAVSDAFENEQLHPEMKLPK